jgi:hypothetical protein
MIINNLSADIDDISSALVEYIIFRRWILQKIHVDTNYLPRAIFFLGEVFSRVRNLH